MKTITKMECVETEIKKSKFISFAYPVNSLEMAENYLCELQNKYNNATHVCFAYILNSPLAEKCSDNGEPSGTAGLPMLNILKKMNFKNVLLVVVRFFGGVKLGAGGLARAYSNACKEVINKCEVITQQKYVVCEIKLNFNDCNKFISYIQQNKFKLISKEYKDKVIICVGVQNVENLKQYLNSTKLINNLKVIEEKYL